MVLAASAKSCSWDALAVTCSSWVMSWNTYENSPRVPPHNATGTLSVVGARHFTPGRKPNLTPGVVVTSPLSPRAAINVPWSNSPLAYGKVNKDVVLVVELTETKISESEEKVTIKITYTEGTTRGYREVMAKKVSEVSLEAILVEASYEVGIVAAIPLLEAVDDAPKKIAEEKDHKAIVTDQERRSGLTECGVVRLCRRRAARNTHPPYKKIKASCASVSSRVPVSGPRTIGGP